MNRPSSRWMHGESENGIFSKATTTLSTASVAALEQQSHPEPSQQIQRSQELQARSQIAEDCEIMPSAHNALLPFNHQQNTDRFQQSTQAYAPVHNGPASSYPGMFNNSRRPTDSRTMSSTGWTRAPSVVRNQHNMPTPRPYSRSGDARNPFASEYKQSNGFEGAGAHGGRFDMPSRPGTSMGNRGFVQNTLFRPNAPEFHPGMSSGMDNSFRNVDGLYNLSCRPGSTTGFHRDINEGGAPFSSPTPRSASRATFGTFEGAGIGFNRPSPLIPQGPNYGPNQPNFDINTDYPIHPRSHVPNSSGHSYHTANFSQLGGFTPGPFGQGGNGSSPTTASPFPSGGGFNGEDSGDNERYARAFEGVWGLARS